MSGTSGMPEKIVGGIVRGIGAGVGLVACDIVVTGFATANGTAAPGRPREEFGPPTDRLGSAENLTVQLLFIALLIALLVIGIRQVRRNTLVAVTAIVAAIVASVPLTPCALSAVENARAAFVSSS